MTKAESYQANKEKMLSDKKTYYQKNREEILKKAKIRRGQLPVDKDGLIIW